MADTVRRQTRGEASRARILEKARSILVEKGYDALVLRQLATSLDMRLGNLQYYFPNRQALMAALIEAEVAADIEALQRAVGGVEPEEALARVVRRLLGRWRSESGVVFATMTFLATQSDDIRAVYLRAYDAFYAEIERILESLDPGKPASVYATRGRLVTALLDGAAMQTRVGERRGYLRSVADAATTIAISDREQR